MYISYVFFLFHKFCINSHSCERVCRLQIKMFLLLLYFTILTTQACVEPTQVGTTSCVDSASSPQVCVVRTQLHMSLHIQVCRMK
jgi:hypothetical protein